MDLLLFQQLQLAPEMVERANVGGDVEEHDGQQGEDDDDGHAALTSLW